MKSFHEIYERALGAYWGLAVGDALGAPLEFMSARSIQRNYGLVTTMIGGGWLNLWPGEVTDDTEMTMLLGRSILQKSGFDLANIAQSWARWLENSPKDVGLTSKRAILRYIGDGSLSKDPDDGDAGNGACMRNLPVALLTLKDDKAFMAYTLAQCHFSHHHPLSDLGTLAFYRMAQSLILGVSKKEAANDLQSLLANEPRFSFAPYAGKNSGYIVDTLQTVFHGFFSTHNFADCLIQVVNLGGDADTIGALAGIVAGAAYGYKAIPKDWLEALAPDVKQCIAEQTEGLLALAHL